VADREGGLGQRSLSLPKPQEKMASMGAVGLMPKLHASDATSAMISRINTNLQFIYIEFMRLQRECSMKTR
jgi:hypothetical protein